MVSFMYPGGKAKLREIIIPSFPKANNYGELFAGMGNIFFSVKAINNYKSYYLNDINTYKFFYNLLKVDETYLRNSLPDEFSYKWYYTMAQLNKPESLLVEHYITFQGKGYTKGGPTSSMFDRWAKNNLIRRLLQAQRLLASVKLSNLDWEKVDWFETWDSDSFVYIDPPYYQTDNKAYDNINHLNLIKKIKNAKFKWVISSYYNELYLNNLGEPFIKVKTVNQFSAFNKGTEKYKQDCLWRNF